MKTTIGLSVSGETSGFGSSETQILIWPHGEDRVNRGKEKTHVKRADTKEMLWETSTKRRGYASSPLGGGVRSRSVWKE